MKPPVSALPAGRGHEAVTPWPARSARGEEQSVKARRKHTPAGRAPALIRGAFLAAVLCLLWAGPARADQICVFRVRPEVERADMVQRDGSVYVGSGKTQRTAQISVGCEGISPDGQSRNLAELIKAGKGKVLYAFWRVKAGKTAPRGETFLLWPKGRQRASLLRKALEGWNLWDVRPWMEEILSSGEPWSVRLQARWEDAGRGAGFDLDGSRIYVILRLEEDEPRIGEDLLTDSDLLDAALSALPESHWALKRYQEEIGSLIQAQWKETGVPYYFGGHSEEKVLHRYFPLQESRYYRADRLYLCGFDCGSFLHWVEEKTGYARHEDLSDLLSWRSREFPLADVPLSDWHLVLRPGDYLLFDHGMSHVGMILGTPRQFGLTGENAPELADWLDYPLMIHCGEDPFCYDRFRAWIETQDFRLDTTPPDGGVTVSLIVPNKEDAPHLRTAPWKKEYGYFDVLGQSLTVYPLADQAGIAWYRPVGPVP